MFDIQATMDAMSLRWKAERGESQMTVGKAILALQEFDQDKLLETPLGTPRSYRGYYSDLAFATGDEIKTVGELQTALKAVIGETFTGYKGGEYRMTMDTPIWSAVYGCCGPRIMDFKIHGPVVRMVTQQEDGE